MEKSVQAIDIATATSGNSVNTTANQSDTGATTPFAQVLAPVHAQAGQPGNPQAAGPGGNTLPGEQALPVSGVPHAASGGADSFPALPILPVNEDGAITPQQANDGAAGVADRPITVTELPVEHIVVEDVPVETAAADQPPLESGTTQVSATGRESTAVPPVPVEQITPAREVSGTGKRVDSGILAQQSLQPTAPQQQTQQPLPAQPATSVNAGMATDATQAAVREGVQQALAAQVAQDGPRQSLPDNSRQARLVTGFTTITTTVETSVASFAAVQVDAMNPVTPGRVAVPFGEAAWGRAVGEQVVWHVSQNIHAANLRLNPQHLGPLEMQVQMDGDKATLAFASQHAVVRDALESALPRLREMFAQNGLDIVDVNVSQEHFPGRQGQEAGVANAESVQEDELIMAGEQQVETDAGVSTNAGLVDYYI